MITLHDDEVTLTHFTGDGDTEGNDVREGSTQTVLYGVLGVPSTRDVTFGSQLGVAVSAVLAIELESPDQIQIGDDVFVRDAHYRAIHVRDVRRHFRVFLERVT